MEYPNIDWRAYSHIIRGVQRKVILKYLNKPMTPTELKDELRDFERKRRVRKSKEIKIIRGLNFNNISRILRSFDKLGIVKCLTPNEKVGRIYVLTEKGEKLKKYLIQRKLI